MKRLLALSLIALASAGAHAQIKIA